MRIRIANLICALVLMPGCAGVGVMQTSDPLIKLNDAAVLYEEQNRPLIAERLIFEAMDIYQERRDFRGLGAAHRTYGNLLRSHAVAYHENYYRKSGFWDKTVTFDNRIDKSAEYHRKALEYYNHAIEPLEHAGEYDALTNVYYNIAWIHCFLDECAESCVYFDKGLEAYEENIRRNPTAEPQFSKPYSSLREQFEAEKKQLGCELESD